MKLLRLFLSLLALLAAVPALRAHEVASVELEFLEQEQAWVLLGEMDIAYMLPESRNVPGEPPLSRAAVMEYPPERLERIRRETEKTLRMLLRVTFGGRELPWRIGFPDFAKQPFELPPEAGDIALLTTQLEIEPQPGAGELRVHWRGEGETELIVLIEEGDDPAILSTLPGGSLMLLKQSGTGAALPADRPLADGWLATGFRHVIPEGRDHMLFILGLFLLAPAWRPLLGQSLLFTVAHSITLGLAVFDLVRVPETVLGIGSPVEVFIALSIAWIGIENLFTRKLGKQRLSLVFAFGLVHGLGFASSVAGKLEDIPRERLVGPLVGFNVGVELGQLAIVAAFLPIAFLLRRTAFYRVGVLQAGSVAVALLAAWWFVERAFDLAPP